MVLNSQDKDNLTWKERFQLWLMSFRSEVSKTTKIGAKMLSASQANTQLQEIQKDLGCWLIQNLENGQIKSEDKYVKELWNKAKSLEEQLATYENDVQEIKKS